MHKVRVEDVCFTQDEQYLISLGGSDDRSIVVWDVLNGNPLCGNIYISIHTYMHTYTHACRTHAGTHIASIGIFITRWNC